MAVSARGRRLGGRRRGRRAGRDAVGLSVPAAAGAASYVLESGQPLALADAARDERAAEGVSRELGARPDSLLAVPCSAGDDLLGVLELVDKRGAESFSIDDVELCDPARPGGRCRARSARRRC